MKTAVLGFAHAHVGMYCDVWRNQPDLGVEVTSAWDHDAARLADVTAKRSLLAFGDVNGLLAQPGLEAVVIGAETSRHADLVVAAARAGKRIVLQKPLALTPSQADTIVQVVAETGVPFTLAWQMRVDPQNLRMKQLIQEGALGRVLMVRRRHGLSTHLWAGFENSWHVRPELNRGMWADDAAHAVDFLYWLLGRPSSVFAEVDTLVNPKIPDDHGIAVFRYADGTFAEVCSSFTCVAGENTTEIVGENGTVIQNYGDAPSCQAPRPERAVGLKWFLRGGQAWIDSGIPSPAGHGERIAGLAAPLAEFLHGRRPPIATAAEGRDVLHLTLACHESSTTGRRINLPPKPSSP
ncbi:MAG: Gfo/Idh/MocA family oxidoreductase [Verrucomicrobia bacterium]|nr:Gfo/Idh/MocA family oxidoreductase [Verrucomicrobiota bacterium]